MMYSTILPPSIINWNGEDYTDAPTYYAEVVMTMPKGEDGIILGAEAHLNALAHLTDSGLYVAESDPKDIYVDRWRVNGPRLAHKHPEFGVVETGWAKGLAEADVSADGVCGICNEVISGEIDMMFRFYQLEG